ncbi:MAG TPA: hypothetical protein VFD84_16270 [Candidatus Binatia bacterium]|nr:hypothetical protein [Candidatus Binatia bacterium]
MSFGANIQPIFDRSCALAGCHLGGTAINGQDLAPGASYRSSVNKPALQKPGFQRVVPGNPNRSYLYLKIIGDPRIVGVLMPQGCPGMPLGGAQCLTSDEIQAINTWITECAPNN